jgi:hypothetical protein
MAARFREHLREPAAARLQNALAHRRDLAVELDLYLGSDALQASASAIGARAAPASVERQQRRADCSYPCDSAPTASIGGADDALLPLLERGWTRLAPGLALPLSG